ncbi:ABC transporter substrate-binding protein [Cohnella faecalis]|uniref:Carbohydrate ABC transporter substrate-binding protein n=1 Tax=Cohnella faecalis TaxID=2315694 RepID=A0A398CN86_9BACL|nr:ABC transporter substrate-binding protein [Cohnella faecalis]RIE00374.1 carbohydrate ABC transporter substrate-binding protein [Cohnella faecalis]
MKKMKAIYPVMSVVLAAAALTACGSNNEKASPSAGSSESAPASASSSPSAEPKKDPVTLTFLIPNTDDVTPYNSIFAEFEKQTGNKVEVQALPGGDYDNMLKTRFSTGDFPDVFLMQPGTKQYVKLRADETLVDWSGEAGVWDDIIDSIKDFQKNTEGKAYGVPFGKTGQMGVFYNKDVFAKANVEPPKNYADLIEIAKKIKAAGVTPFYEAVKEGWPTQVFYLTGWVSQVDQAIGAEGVQKLNVNQAKLADIPELKDLFAKAKQLKDLGLYQKNALSGTYDELQNEFGDGKVGMIFMLDGILPQLEKKFGKDFLTDKVGFFPFPSAADTGTAMITPPNQLMVPSKAKHLEQAKELVKFMISKDSVNTFYASQPGIPIFKSATSELYPVQKTVQEYIDAGKSTVNVQNRLTASFLDLGKTLQTFHIKGDVDAALNEMSANYMKDGNSKRLEGFE